MTAREGRERASGVGGGGFCIGGVRGWRSVLRVARAVL